MNSFLPPCHIWCLGIFIGLIAFCMQIAESFLLRLLSVVLIDVFWAYQSMTHSGVVAYKGHAKEAISIQYRIAQRRKASPKVRTSRISFKPSTTAPCLNLWRNALITRQCYRVEAFLAPRIKFPAKATLRRWCARNPRMFVPPARIPRVVWWNISLILRWNWPIKICGRYSTRRNMKWRSLTLDGM